MNTFCSVFASMCVTVQHMTVTMSMVKHADIRLLSPVRRHRRVCCEAQVSAHCKLSRA